MFAVFVSGSAGLRWVGNDRAANGPTVQDAMYKADTDAVLVVPLAAFADVDGAQSDVDGPQLEMFI